MLYTSAIHCLMSSVASAKLREGSINVYLPGDASLVGDGPLCDLLAGGGDPPLLLRLLAFLYQVSTRCRRSASLRAPFWLYIIVRLAARAFLNMLICGLLASTSSSLSEGSNIIRFFFVEDGGDTDLASDFYLRMRSASAAYLVNSRAHFSFASTLVHISASAYSAYSNSSLCFSAIASASYMSCSIFCFRSNSAWISACSVSYVLGEAWSLPKLWTEKSGSSPLRRGLSNPPSSKLYSLTTNASDSQQQLPIYLEIN